MKILLLFLFATAAAAVDCSPEFSGFVNDEDTNHFIADCGESTANGETCPITEHSMGYSGGSVTCTDGQYVVVVATLGTTNPETESDYGNDIGNDR